MSIIAYIANIFRGELGRGKRNSSFFNLHSSLSFILSIALLFGVSGAWAADWTDKDDPNVTYTALKSINGGGNGTAAGGFIITDITPAGTEIVKFKVKTPAAVTKNGCVYCARSFTKSGNKWTVDATQFAGFRLAKKFRIDRKGTQTSLDDETCTPATEYSVSANYSTGAVTVNNLVQSQNLSTDTGSSYTPGGKLAILASYSDIAAPASPTASSSWYNCSPDDLYYLQLWKADGKTLAHNFMPAVRDSNSVTGLYDTVTRKFYSAAKGSLKGAAYGASERAGKKWTGLGDGVSLSDGMNWLGGTAPKAGDDLDFTIAVPNAEIVADIKDTTFGKVYLGTGDIPQFTGALSATAINDLPKMQAYDTAEDDFTFTLAAPIGQDFTWNGAEKANWWAADAWNYNTAASVWYDNNTAVFNTANATATLNANVTAESVVFGEDATIVTNGTDAATLTVPTISVAQNFTATIAAPTSGALAKTGAGTLTLKSSRSETTTLFEGTLVFSGNDTKLDWSKLTLGTDPAKPVTLRFEGGAALASESEEYRFGNREGITSTICKSGGDWIRGETYIGDAADANTTFVNESGDLTFTSYLYVGAQTAANATGSSELAIAGGKVAVSGSTGSQWVSVGTYDPGIVTVTNNAAFDVTLDIAFSQRTGSGTLNVSDGGTARIGGDIIFGSKRTDAGTGTVNIGQDGTVIADSIRCHDYGSGIVKFDGGTLKAGGEGKTLIQPSERMTVNVGANSGTIDNDGKNISIAQKMTGDGGMTFSGSGTTTISENQEYTGTTTVSEGTTLSVGGGVTFAGSVKFKSGSRLNIANYTAGVTPFTAQSLILPEDEGIVSLTLNGGAFGEGSYVICSASGMTATNGEKFKFDTEGDLVGKWSVDGSNTLILTVGEIDPNAWTGRGGDGRMSTGANWGGGKVPEAYSKIDLSGIAVDTTIIADANMTFGEVTMGTGVITFTGEFTAKSFSDTSKIAVGADSTVTVLGDLEFGAAGNAYICYSVAQGGKFEVTGDIIITPEQTKSLLPCVVTVNEGVISAKGLVSRSSNDLFALSWFQDNASAKWLIGENGICGTGKGGFFVGDKPGGQATIIAATDFVVSAHIISWRNLTFDTAGYTVTLGTNTLAKSGGISGNTASVTRSIEVRGRGKVVVNYNVNDLTTSSISRNNAFTVTDGATLAFNPGANIGTGLLTIESGAALEIPQSHTVTHNGNLSLENGAALAFNFTDRKTAPVLTLAEGKAVTFTGEGEIAVKITGDLWPIGGDYVLTTCGGFDAEGVTVSLADGAPKWAKGIGVNEDGNIVLTVRPKPTMIIVR